MKQIHVAAALATIALSAASSQASSPMRASSGGSPMVSTADDEPPCNYIRVRCPNK